MTKSLSSAISGIEANQEWLDNIANNIANANTVGFQANSVQFADLLYQQQQAAGGAVPGQVGGTNPIVVGSGVRVAATSTDFSQGTLEQTGNPTDVAIQGQGFLVVSSGGQTYYTRAGNLQLDATGQLVTPSGAIVQGWVPGAGGTINQNSPLGAIVIPQGQVANPVPTGNIDLGGNLPAGYTQPVVVTTTAYDDLGNAVPITLTFTPSTTVANTWTVTAQTVDPGTNNQVALTLGGASSQTVTFDPNTGQISAISGSEANNPDALALSGFPGGYAFPNGYSMNLTFPQPGTQQAVTQFAASSPSVQVTYQDGAPSGALTGFTIGSNGVVEGQYANGKSQVLGQIATALFANPEGLAKQGNLLYASTLNSGAAQLGAPGQGGRGQLVGGSLEESNVSIGKELTDLIVAQTAYQANTKVVSTTATVLQSLVQMA
jgi:flagellar hook protein FlgE